MLSRAAFRLAQPIRPLPALVRICSNVAGVRDEKNFPRPVHLVDPGKVRLGFIPEEWFLFFHKKTGVTGPYVFGTGLITYLLSKEYWVIEHEFYVGLTLLLMTMYANKKYGPGLAAFLDKEIKEDENSMLKQRNDQLENLNNLVENEKLQQWRADGQKILFDAKKENVQLQLEGIYRERLMNVYSEVKRRLDYQIEKQNIDRRINQKHMVQWIVNSVRKSITPDQEREALNKCIADLGVLATRN